jgi:hypothetical protein
VSAHIDGMPSLPPGAPAARPGGGTGPLRHGNPRGDPNSAPRCGARARTTGCPCRAPAMANGRCRMHGGRCKGPRTAEGMARMIAAKTTHGMYAAAGAPQRAQQRYVNALVERSRLLCSATLLRAYLPPEMAARLAVGPAELATPVHLSQVAFATRHATMTHNVRKGAARLGRNSATGRGVAEQAGVALRLREAERLAARAEADATAPWKAAIAIARAAKRAARGGRARPSSGTMPAARNNTMQREIALRAAGLRAAGLRAVGLRAAGFRAPGRSPAALDAPRQSASRADRAPPARRISGEAGNDAIQPEPGAARGLMRLTPTKATAPRSTTLVCTWVSRKKATAAGGFRCAAPPGSHAPQGSPVGVAPVLRAGCVQQFHTEPARACRRA